MSTRITVTTSDLSLVQRVQEVQRNGREGQLQREVDAQLTSQVREAAAEAQALLNRPRGGLPNTDVARRPAAQREETGIFAAELKTRYDENSNTFFVAASVPGVDDVVEIATAASGRGSVTPEPGYTDTTLFTAYGRVYKDIDTNEWSIYRNGSFGEATNYEDRLAEPPRTSNQTDVAYRLFKRTADQSVSLMLPLSGSDGVLLYIHNRIEFYNKYTESTNKVYSSVNERNIRINAQTLEPYQWGDPGYVADWDAQGHTRITYTYTGQQAFPAYQILAFYVSDQGVKQINVPPALAASLEAIYPPVSANGSMNSVGEINYDQYYAHNPIGFVNVTRSNYTTTYQSEPVFDQQVWQQSSKYGLLQPNSYVLPQHFGLGYLNTNSHGGSFFTPAVFRFISGTMTLNDATAQSYAAMRSAYFSNAPFTFYAPCARTGSCQDITITEFDLTRTQPETVTTALADTLFRRNKATDVEIGEPEGEILYGWDWGNPAQCRSQALALGFSSAELSL